MPEFESGDDVVVTNADGEELYTGEFAGDNGDGTATVVGPAHPSDPSGFRRVDLDRIQKP